MTKPKVRPLYYRADGTSNGGIGDCPDGKLRRQQFQNAGWKKVTLTQAVEIDRHHEDMGGREYPEHRHRDHSEIPELVMKKPFDGRPIPLNTSKDTKKDS